MGDVQIEPAVPEGAGPHQLVVQEVLQVLEPIGGGVGRTEDGRTVVRFDAIVRLRSEFVLDEHAKGQLVRGLTGGLEVATPAQASALLRP